MPDPSPRLPLSVSIVCCDNASTIERCVASVSGWVSEIVAVDSGSTDGTLEILRSHAEVRVVEQPWLGYVKQKQFALEQCTQPWVLHLDSDESVEPDLRQAIETFITEDGRGRAGAMVNRKVWYRGRALNHAWQPEWRLRLVRQGSAKWGGLDPHDAMEFLDPAALGSRLSGDLRHDSVPDIAGFLARQVSHARIGAESAHAAGKRTSLLKLVTSPVGAWLKQMVVRRAFLDGWRGWLAASATAIAAAMKHMVLLELGDQGRGTRDEG